MTLKRPIKVALVALWIAAIIALIGLAAHLLQSFVAPESEQTASIAPVQTVTKPEEHEVRLFFSDADASLLPEKRLIPLGSGLQADATALTNELLNGPRSEGLEATIPPETKLLNVYRVGDILVLDFSRELQENHPGGSAGELVTVYSIVNTMVENLHGIKKVQILIEGAEVDTLVGHLDLSKPLARNIKWMKPLSPPKSAP